MRLFRNSAFWFLVNLLPHAIGAQSPPSQPPGVVEPLRGHSGMIYTLAYTPDGQTLISAGADQTLRFWRLQQDRIDDTEQTRRGQLLTDVNHPRFAVRQQAFEQLAQLGVAIRPELDKQLESTLSPEAELRMRRLIAMSEIPQGIGHNREVRGVAVSPDGKTAASAGRDHVIALWNVAMGRPLAAIRGHSDGVWCVAFSLDGRHLASGGGDHRVRIWSVETRMLAVELSGHESTVHDLAFSCDGNLLASAGGFDHTVRVWDLKSSRCVRVLAEHNDAVMCLAISPDGKWIASGGYEGRIFLWDSESGKCIRSFAAHEGTIRDIAFSPRDRSQLISVGDDRLAYRWDCATGGKMATYQRHLSSVRAIAFAPDGKSFATADGHGVIHRWPIE